MVFTVLPIRYSTTNVARAERGMESKNRRGGAKAAEKEQNHDAGEKESDEALVQHRLDRFLDVHRLIEHQGGGHLLGDVEQVADQVPHPVDHLNGVGIAPLLHDGDVTRFLAVHPHDVVLNLIGVLGLPHVSHRDPRGPHRLDGDIVQVLHLVHQAIGIDVVIVGAHLHIAGGQDQIRLVHRVHHVHGSHLARKELVGVHVHHGLPVLPAKRRRDLRPLHHRNLVADGKLRVVVKLRFGEPLPFHRHQANRQAGGIKLQHHGRQGAGRQALQVGQGQVGDFRHIGVGAGSRLEVNLDNADSQHANAIPCDRCRWPG